MNAWGVSGNVKDRRQDSTRRKLQKQYEGVHGPQKVNDLQVLFSSTFKTPPSSSLGKRYLFGLHVVIAWRASIVMDACIEQCVL